VTTAKGLGDSDAAQPVLIQALAPRLEAEPPLSARLVSHQEETVATWRDINEEIARSRRGS
jgi:hypothetical protein